MSAMGPGSKEDRRVDPSLQTRLELIPVDESSAKLVLNPRPESFSVTAAIGTLDRVGQFVIKRSLGEFVSVPGQRTDHLLRFEPSEIGQGDFLQLISPSPERIVVDAAPVDNSVFDFDIEIRLPYVPALICTGPDGEDPNQD